MDTPTQRFRIQLGFQLLSERQRQRLRDYLRVTEYGRCYVSPEAQYELVKRGELTAPDEWNGSAVLPCERRSA